MFFYQPFSEECTSALNQVVAYYLHTSHVYLAMYFETLADTRREDADKFLKHLWKRNQSICPPTYEEVDLKEITTPIKALLLAQEMEKTVTGILKGLQAHAKHESDLLTILTSVLRKQKKNEDYMKNHLTYHQKIESEREKKAQATKPSTSSGKKA